MPGRRWPARPITVAGAVETAFVEHAYIEPEAGAAWLDGDTLVIRACTQAPVMDRDDTAAILGLPPERRAHHPLGGRRRLRRRSSTCRCSRCSASPR